VPTPLVAGLAGPMTQFPVGLGLPGLHTEALGYESLESPYTDGRVKMPPPALILTGCSTDSAANGSQRIGRPCGYIGLAKLTLGDKLDVTAGIGQNRARRLARNAFRPI
jgi:hypothetical protein